MERKLEIGKFDIRDGNYDPCAWGALHPLDGLLATGGLLRISTYPKFLMRGLDSP